MKPGHVSLERALSKLGIASRTVAHQWILAGRVRVNGVIRKQPLFPVFPEKAKIEIDREPVVRSKPKVGQKTTFRFNPDDYEKYREIFEKELHIQALAKDILRI